MLQKLSYFNLVFAIIYLLVYLKSGTFNSTAGIFVIIVFNWLCLRSYQLDRYQWRVWHYLVGLWSLYFIGTLVYGTANILTSSLTYNFMSNDTLAYLLMSTVFSLSVLLHLGLYFKKSYKAVN